MVGDEVQRIDVVQSIPELLAVDSSQCMSKVVPKMVQVLSTSSAEYHIVLSEMLSTIIRDRLISPEIFVQTFLQDIIHSLDNQDPVIFNAWLNTLVEVIDLLPINVIQSEVFPIALARAQLSKPVSVRLSSCKILGSIGKRYDAALLKKDILPTVTSLCQDVSGEVRATMCSELKNISIRLGGELAESNLLPSIIELSTDEVSNVKEATFKTVVNILHIFSIETLRNTIIPMLNQMIKHSFQFDESLLVVVSEHYGKMCSEIERAVPFSERNYFLKYYITMSEAGSFQQGCLLNLSFSEKYVNCRQNCAYNLPALAKFCYNDFEPKYLKSLHIVIHKLANDTYSVVRRTVACGFHEVARIYEIYNAMLKPEIIRIMQDESEEVLEGFIPNLVKIINYLTETGVYKNDSSEPLVGELYKSLLKCESIISLNHNWRLQCTIFELFENILCLLPADKINDELIPLLFNRINTCRIVPVRLAAIRLIYVFLHTSPKRYKADLRTRIINNFCLSSNFYDRMLFIRSCEILFELFSTNYFKEFFFFKTIQLFGDPVANIRLAMCKMIPKLKCMLKVNIDRKLIVMLDSAIHECMEDKDKEVVRCLHEMKLNLNCFEFAKLFPNDTKKYEEEKLPISRFVISHLGGVSSLPLAQKNVNSARKADKFQVQSSKLISKLPRNSSKIHRDPLPINDKDFMVDAGIRLPIAKPQRSRVFREPSYSASSSTTVQNRNVDIVSNGNNNTDDEKSSQKKANQLRQGIPVRTAVTSKARNLNNSIQKRHSLEVVDLNQNNFDGHSNVGEKSVSLTNCSRAHTSRRQSHLPRPLSCINFPARNLDVPPTKPVSRLPVSSRYVLEST